MRGRIRPIRSLLSTLRAPQVTPKLSTQPSSCSFICTDTKDQASKPTSSMRKPQVEQVRRPRFVRDPRRSALQHRRIFERTWRTRPTNSRSVGKIRSSLASKSGDHHRHGTAEATAHTPAEAAHEKRRNLFVRSHGRR